MSASNKSDKLRELELFEEALIASIADASDADVLEVATAHGEDPVATVQKFDSLLAAAKVACGLVRLQAARHQLVKFAASSRPVDDRELESARVCFAAARWTVSYGPQNFLLAARNGQGATEQDLESLVSDYAELERLEREQGVES